MSLVSLDGAPALDRWLALQVPGRVSAFTGKVDIGQRISTALIAMVADELEVDPARIDLQPVSTCSSPNERYTAGSNSVEDSGGALRLAAATAREHMLGMAAGRLGVEKAALEVRDGTIVSRDGGAAACTYWELMLGRRFCIDVDVNAALRPASGWRLIGRPAVPREMRSLVDGSARFIHDLALPDMLHARVIRPPHPLARLRHVPGASQPSLASAGIELLRDGDFLALAGPEEYPLLVAAGDVSRKLQWDVPPETFTTDLERQLDELPRRRLPVVDGVPLEQAVPDAAAVPAAAEVTLEARYYKPYLLHASLAPSAAAALWQQGRLEVWTHSQGIYPLRDSLAEALGLAAEAIEVHHARGSGCYGHNGADDAALDAALVARLRPGRPILLKWSREDEHLWEPCGPAMSMRLRASLDGSGQVLQWSHETCSDSHIMRPRPGPGRAGAARLLAARWIEDAVAPARPRPVLAHHAGIHRNLEPLYDFPAMQLVKTLVEGLPVRTSALRTLGAAGNVFAIESFMDELAAAAGIEPLEFRRRHLRDARALAVLDRLAGAVSHQPDRRSGTGLGIGLARYKNEKAYCAVAVELDVTEMATVVLRRAVMAADVGQVIDPEGVRAQLEGGLLQAASWCLHEELRLGPDGRAGRDWDSYPVLRFGEVIGFEIETLLLDRPADPPLGVGEASPGPAVAAIANAIALASGVRVRRMPFTPENIRAAAY